MNVKTIPFTAAHWNLLPVPAGHCPDCAAKHDAAAPHNAQSLHYQYAFYLKHQRWPNWLDAMSHCDPRTKELWTKALNDRGVDVAGGQVN